MQTVTSSQYNIKNNQIELLKIAEGFLQSSVLFALVDLKILENIGKDTTSSKELAHLIGVKPETLSRLLNAGVALGLLESEDGYVYRLSELCRDTLIPTAGDQYLGNWIRNLKYFQHVFLDLEKAVINSKPVVSPEKHLGNNPEITEEYILAMHNYASLRGRELAQFLGIEGHKSLLDLGCGPGTYAFHIGEKNPDLEIVLADFPDVLEIAKKIGASRLPERQIRCLPLDATKDEIPGTYDVVIISNMLHMLNEDNCRKLIRRLFNNVKEGGSIVIQAQFLKDDRLGGRWPVLLDLIQLCITKDGRNHSVAETRDWLTAAGFMDIEYCSMTLLNTNSYLRGYKL